MAQYNVTGTCGHNTHVELFGKNTGRQSRLEWMACKPCTACWLRGQGKFGAAAAQARRSGEDALADEIIETERAKARPPVQKPVEPVVAAIAEAIAEIPEHLVMTNAELAELGL